MTKPTIIEAETPERIKGFHPNRRIGTAFPADNLVINGYGTHMTSQLGYIEWLNQQRTLKQRPPIPKDQAYNLLEKKAVDLIYTNSDIEIRPNPDQMNLALATDKMLQEIEGKHHIKFLFASDPNVRRALMLKGECYRLASTPKTEREIQEMIISSRTNINTREMYHYNKSTGTRWLTYEDFSRLGESDDQNLALNLQEIGDYSQRKNRQKNQEVDFFMAQEEFIKRFQTVDFTKFTTQEIREYYNNMKLEFYNATEPDFRKNDITNTEWRNAMLSALISINQPVPEEILMGLSPVYRMRVKWLPGARIEHGGVLPDPIYTLRERNPEDKVLEKICGYHKDIVSGIIKNNFREYPDMRAINIGEVSSPLSKRENKRGRRGVYVVEMNFHRKEQPLVRIVRLQKTGEREFLDLGDQEQEPLMSKSINVLGCGRKHIKNRGLCLGEASIRSEEVTEYVLDRHLACRQLGMSLFPITLAKVREVYNGTIPIWTTYFERDYVSGRATDKIPLSKYSSPEFSKRFAILLGRAAASNLIIGRTDNNKVLFDDGDEVLQEEADLPKRIVIADHTGSFESYKEPLENYAAQYALPIISRQNHIRNPEEFLKEYLSAFSKKFKQLQREYRIKRQAFDNLFSDRKDIGRWNLAERWSSVLRRMDNTSPNELEDIIRTQIIL